MLGRHDVRRVARDQVVLLVTRRLEEAAVPALDVVEPVERGVQLGVRERARVDVDGDDVAVVPRGEERVDAAAGADVERTLAALARREHVARPRRRRVVRDVVRRVVRVAREAVRGEQHVVDRHEPRVRDDVAPQLGEPRRRERLHRLPAERVDRVRLRHGQLEEEQPHRRRELRPGQPPLGDEHLLAPAGEGVLVEQVLELLLDVAEPAQRGAECRSRGAIGDGVRHRGAIMSHPGSLDGRDRRG